MKVKGLLLAWALPVLLFAQPSGEDCNNGLDDDGDGLTDLNDPDCICKGIRDTFFVPSSLIPNPSFEEFNCCPTGLAQMNCSKNWIQASSATSDYFHTCGFKEDFFRGSPPQPLPAGNGYVGFLDLYTHPARNAVYKEYIGACLTSPMRPGREYTLSFWIGFGQPGNNYGPRASTTLGIFGTNQCGNLPFGTGTSWLCPTNYPGWIEMVRVSASGRNRWVKVKLKLTPNQTIEAIAIGPQCTRADGYYYYFLDELLLEETVRFDSLLLSISGSPCSDDVFLNSPPSNVTGINYQWYRDGVAIFGATSSNFKVPRGAEGNYVLKAIDGTDCELSNGYHYQLDTFYQSIDTAICSGDSVVIGGVKLDQTGNYQIPLRTSEGCDSLLDVRLQLKYPSNAFFDTNICEGQTFTLGQRVFDQAGDYAWTVPGANGCDSLTSLRLVVHPVVQTKWDTFLCEGQTLIAGSNTYTSAGMYTQIATSAVGCDSIHTILLRMGKSGTGAIDTSICQGSFVELNGKQFDKTGTYTMNLQTAEGCDSLLQLRLVVHPVYEDHLNVSRCEGDTFRLAGYSFFKTGDHPLRFTSFNGCDSTIWVHLNIERNAATAIDTLVCFDQSVVLGGKVYSDSGRYVLNYQSSNGCDSVVSIRVRKTPQPVWNIMKGDPLCHGDRSGWMQVSLPVDGSPYRFLWSDGSNDDRRASLGAGPYDLTVTDRWGCKTSGQIELLQPDPLQFEIDQVNANCHSPNSGKLLLKRTSGGTPAYSLRIDAVSHSIDTAAVELEVGFHQVELVDANGCSQMRSLEILAPVEGGIQLMPDTIEVILGDSVFLSANTSVRDSISKIEWTGPGFIACPGCLETMVFSGAQGGRFEIVITDVFGCRYSAAVYIRVRQDFFVPNAFSPNGDNINDFFNLFSDRSVDRIETLRIFDRWGNLQYEGRNIYPNGPSGAWNGESQGVKCLPGVYVYQILFRDKANIQHRLAGDITLIR
ncbi:MAG: gliding motility-associated C-terminal domain-containing protein [Saprospiraceae bacterium]|nr:gliding motility-associated C-terminal domain-containing protein [Saprospiraceae bacterium]